jgi:hypothetical protein
MQRLVLPIQGAAAELPASSDIGLSTLADSRVRPVIIFYNDLWARQIVLWGDAGTAQRWIRARISRGA